MKITPGSIHKTVPFAPTKTPVGPGSSPPPVSLPSELYIPQSAPPSAAPPPAAAGLPEPPAAEFKAEAPPSPAPPPPPKPPETQNWMDQAWNLGPASPGLNPSQDDFWKYPSPKSSDLHQKSILIEPDATYFVSGSHPGAGSALGGITNFNQQAMDLQMKMAEDMKAKQAAYYAENSPASA
ncbi:hypothetical protein JST97_06015, partial [bacterium]|nr:hypothetical protein [bacterium]